MNLSKYQSKFHILNIKKSITIFIFSIAIFSAITSVNSANSYALTYESQADIGFTINDTIKLSITGNIIIPELFPGTTGESNIVDIKVSTNTKNGYSLSAKMGTASADLTTANSGSKFTGLPTNASESTLADDTWGYKTKTSDGAWSNYSGLPTSTDTEKILVERSSQPTGGEETTQFKIGAHASTSMPANTYSNTIIFHAVANPTPEPSLTFDQAFASTGAEKLNGYYKIQDMTTEICSSITPALDTTAAGTQITTLIDIRDNNTYTVAKLLDGNCWMTQNLALGGGTPITLTPDDTDIAENWTLPASHSDTYHEDFGCDDSGIESVFNKNFASENWKLCYGDPASYDDNIGNYYTGKAAIANTNTSGMKAGDIVPYSICPKGWKLPADYPENGYEGKSVGDFSNLISLYHYNDYIMEKLPPLSVVDSGSYAYGQFNPSEFIELYSSVFDGPYGSIVFFITHNSSSTEAYTSDAPGYSIRCLAR